MTPIPPSPHLSMGVHGEGDDELGEESAVEGVEGEEGRGGGGDWR